MMVLEGRHRAYIYILAAYVAHATYHINKMSKVSTLPYIGHIIT